MNNHVITETFCKRYFDCSYFNEEYSYVTIVRNVVREFVSSYFSSDRVVDTSKFYSSFVDRLNSRVFRGRNLVSSGDLDTVIDLCLHQASNIHSLINTYDITNFNSWYLYKNRIKGSINGIINIDNVDYTVDFSFVPIERTLTDLNFHKFNMYAYNISNDTTYDHLVYNAVSNNLIKMKFNKDNYTIKRGMVTGIIRNRHKIHSDKCHLCSVKECNYRIVHNFGRL